MPFKKNQSSGKRKGPKSFKADGTPKKRWSAEQRAALGHGPRRRGGRRGDDIRPQFGGGRERSDSRFDERDERPANRAERRERQFGDDRAHADRNDRRSFNRDERPRFERDDRPRFERDDRPRFDRDDRRGRDFDRRDRDERPRHDRDDRRSFNRDERPRFERDDRARFNRDERRGRDFDRRDRDDRPRFNRDERPRHDRDDRRPFNRDERPRFERDDRRPDRRDDRPRFDRRRDERPRGAWGRPDRDDRPRFERHGHDHSDDVDMDVMEWSQEEVEVDTTGVDTSQGFGELGLPAEIVALLHQRGIDTPFPIQVATIPDALAGHDVLGRARTGSGKTLAFSLPVITRLSEGDEHKRNHGKSFRTPRALVLVPTRELALQVADVMSPLASSLGLKLVLVAGGMSFGPQLKAFERGVDIVVATPGRLIDLLEQGAADLSDVQIAVLDEADHMADLGFMQAVTTLLDAVNENSQKMLFSATLDGAVNRLVRTYLHDPVTHEVDPDKGSVATMEHAVLLVKPHHKNELAAWIANREGRTVIFARTQMGSDRIAGQLRDAGVMAGALHGGLTQGARARMLAAFKEGTLPVLVATDVAARGIHVDEVSLVLQIDPPMNAKDYTHRAGRTARAGEKGVVVTVALPHQRKQVLRMIGSTGVKITTLEVMPGDEALVDLTGAQAPTGAPIAEEELKALVAPRVVKKARPDRFADRGGHGGRGGRGGWKGGRGGGRGGWKKGGRDERRPRLAEPGSWDKD